MREQLLKAMREQSIARVRRWFDERLIDIGKAKMTIDYGPGRGPDQEPTIRVTLRVRYRVHGETHTATRTAHMPVCAHRDEVDDELTELTAAVLDEVALVRSSEHPI